MRRAADLMKNDPTLETITQELCQKQGCHTVILYGSRARGEATSLSDYDVLGIRESGDIWRDARLWNGIYLDTFVYPEAKIEQPDENLLHIRGGIVLKQKGDLGSRFLERLEKIYQAGPKGLAPDEIRARKTWARKMLVRATQSDAEGDYRRVWLLTALLEDYFLIRRQWYQGSKKALQWLETYEPKTYELYRRAIKPNATLSEVEKLVDAVVEEDEFQLERITDLSAAPLIQEILDAAPAYTMNTEGISSQPNGGTECLTTFPDCKGNQKHFFILRQNGKAVGVADVIKDFPEKHTAFIGLLLFREDCQKRGLGKIFYRKIEGMVVRDFDAKKLRLSVVDSNPVQPFWNKMGFRLTDIAKPHEGVKLKSTKRVMEKVLS